MQHLQVMADRRLRQPEGFGQIAHAGFLVGLRCDQRHEPQACRIRQDLQGPREALRLLFGERCSEQGRAAVFVDLRDELHAMILTAIYTSVNISTMVDIQKGGQEDV